LVFPGGMPFIAIADNENGPVLGEVSGKGPARSLSLRPGRFFIRGRGEDYLLEGTVSVAAGQVHTVDKSTLKRVDYARLVRKGATAYSVAHAAELGFTLRSPLPNAESICYGGLIGYRLDLEQIGLGARFSACTSSFDNDSLSARTNEFALSLGVDHTWDFPAFSVSLALGIGSTLTHQSFETIGHAPARLSLSPTGFVGVGAVRDISHGLYVGLDLRLEGYLLRFQQSALAEEELRAEAAVRVSPVLGLRF